MTMEQQSEPAFVAFSAMPSRPRIIWPDQKKLAASVFLHFEHWDVAAQGNVFDPRFSEVLGGSLPDYLTGSWFEYGNRVGMFRVLAALDRYNVKVTVAANAFACRHYPELVREFTDRGYEFAAHGTHANHIISSRMTASEERAMIQDSIDAVAKACGVRPVGWVGQSYGESERTPALLEELGIRYVVDWANDEQPYRFTAGGGLVSLPCQVELDDVELLYHRKMFPWIYPSVWSRAIEHLGADGAASGRFLGLHVHPWVVGKAYISKYFEAVLDEFATSDAIWHATAADVAFHVAGA